MGTEDDMNGREHNSPCDLVNNLAMMYRNERRFEEARNVMSRCVPSTETMAATLNNLGMLEMDAGKFQAAADYFKRAIDEMKKQSREHDEYFEVMTNNLIRAQGLV